MRTPALPPLPESAAVAPVAGSCLWALGGLLAGGCALLAVYAMTAAPGAVVLGLASNAPMRALASIAFDDRKSLTEMQILSGINGEAIGENGTALAQDGSAALLQSEIAPVAWDRLSAGDCISLTIKSGQKLSFRIVGAHSGDTAHNDAKPANIELAVTACSPGSEAILKAVIESKAGAKQSAVQRNL